MVHQYKNNGYDIVLDVNSGAIHVVDDVTYDVIEMIDQSQPESYARDEIVSALSGKYGKEEVEEAIDEVQTLIDEESLFTKDTFYKGHLRKLYHGFQKTPDGCQGTLPAYCT